MGSDISNSVWSTTDASNNAASPNGYSSSTTPANVVAIQQAERGALKRLYERLGPALTSTGSANAYVVTPSNTGYPVALVQGDIYCFIANFTNSGAATLAYNGLTATAITKMGTSGPTALTGNEIQTNQVVIVAYDGTQFQLVSALPAPSQTGYAALTGASFSGAVNFAQGANIASASTTAIGAGTGNYINITGTTTITAFDTVQAGTERILNFNGILTLTYNASSLILPGAANITTAAGDIGRFVSLGSGNWVCTAYSKASGNPVATAIALATYLGFTTSASANGYVKLPGGIIVQWGSATGASGSTSVAATFPLTFPTNLYQIVQNYGDSGHSGSIGITSSSTAGATFHITSTPSGTATVNYIAIGN